VSRILDAAKLRASTCVSSFGSSELRPQCALISERSAQRIRKATFDLSSARIFGKLVRQPRIESVLSAKKMEIRDDLQRLPEVLGGASTRRLAKAL
jgi:hypothetical protein